MSVHRVLGGTVLALAGLLAWQVLTPAPEAENPGTVMIASWAHVPESLEEAIDMSREIVVGKVVRVRKARDLEIPAEDEPERVDQVPVQSVTFQIEKTHKAPADRQGRPETIEVFHTGGLDSEDRPIMLEGDPEYRPGQRYLLFLMEGPELNVEGSRVLTRSVLAPEGRYGVGRDGNLVPASTRGRSFAAELKGQSLTALERRIADHTNGKGGNRP